MKPIVVVGRPNVGKSTFFNRMLGERVAIVEDLPGTRAIASTAIAIGTGTTLC